MGRSVRGRFGGPFPLPPFGPLPRRFPAFLPLKAPPRLLTAFCASANSLRASAAITYLTLYRVENIRIFKKANDSNQPIHKNIFGYLLRLDFL